MSERVDQYVARDHSRRTRRPEGNRNYLSGTVVQYDSARGHCTAHSLLSVSELLLLGTPRRAICHTLSPDGLLSHRKLEFFQNFQTLNKSNQNNIGKLQSRE